MTISFLMLTKEKIQQLAEKGIWNLGSHEIGLDKPGDKPRRFSLGRVKLIANEA